MTQDRPQEHLPVAVDAMGGDRAPRVVIEGAIAACQSGAGPIVLVGDQTLLASELERLGGADLPITLQHASEQIAMGENPSRAARRKRDSSMHGCFRLVENGEACAAVTAGNSGAFLAVGLLTVRRLKKCERPCLVTSLPTQPKPTILLDIGANVDVRATHLAQFALMGAAYSEVQYGTQTPSVALLSNGTEPTKGTDSLREAHRLLTQTPINYIGFVEGRDLSSGCADVVVTDGLTGNIVLKLCEGLVKTLFGRVKTAIQSRPLAMALAPVFRRPLQALYDELDWESIGAAPILGLNGVALVGHGQSSAKAISNAIINARRASSQGLTDAIETTLEMNAPSAEISTSELPLSSTDELFDE
ncbi:MAG: phosphate acyltransferase PlsX [Myxococcota bacterium]|nr:phosphate acyltransferase PlsX [Myxococcota bacterium]